MSKQVNTLGVDIAKNVFQLYGLDESGDKVISKKVKRKEFVEQVTQLQPKVVAMEACAGAHHWARRFKALGMDTKLISAKIVKGFLQSNIKNDVVDAMAIAQAAESKATRTICEKTLEQQDIQSLLSARAGCIRTRTRLINEARGFAQEYGVVIPQGVNKFYRDIMAVIADAENGLTNIARQLLNRLYEEVKQINKMIVDFEMMLAEISKQHKQVSRLESIPGVGMLSALAIIAIMGDPKRFKNGRHFAAYLGLVPKQHSSGGKTKLLGITKNGDCYTRMLLVHGARAVLRFAKKHESAKSQWLSQLHESKGYNKASVALANKNARIIWAVMKTETVYDEKLAWAA